MKPVIPSTVFTFANDYAWKTKGWLCSATEALPPPKPSVQERTFGKASSQTFKPHFSSVPFVLAQELNALGWVMAIDFCELQIMLLVNGARDMGQNGQWNDNQRCEPWCHLCIINSSVYCFLLYEKSSEYMSIDYGVRMNQSNFP